MSFFSELQRRNVIRVAVAYLVTAWLVAQVLELLFDSFGTPDWVMKTIIVLMGFGLIFAVIFAWAYELTPDGIRREVDVNRDESIAPLTARRLDRTIIVVLVLAVGYFIWESRIAERPPLTDRAGPAADTSEAVDSIQAPEPSIAVLPFADMSPDGDQEYFSDGIAEELLNLLVRVDGLKVASRTSSFAYKDSSRGIAEIARELKVDHVLEGSVRKADNRVRITAQLIDADTDRHLWSDTYDRELNDIFAIQDEIANAIVDALKAELGMLADAGPIDVQAATENLDAYELYLEGRSLFLSRLDIGRSIELLEGAIELDPNFARAWEDLAAAYSVSEGWTGQDRREDSQHAARRALELDPDLSMAWAVLAEYSINSEFDFVKGMREFDRAIENDPLNATAWFWRGLRYGMLGELERAVADIEHCIDLDPAYLNCYRHVSAMYAALGEDDSALERYLFSLKRGLSIHDFWVIPLLLKRDADEAAAFAMLNESGGDPDYPFVEFWEALKSPGQVHEEGIREFDAWISRTPGVNSKFKAVEWAVLGAFDRVEYGLDSYRVWQEVYRDFRSSPYFKPFIEQANVLPYWRMHGFPPMCQPVGEDDFQCD
ncbi:MAG: hypothetical protein R3348_05630 [Xanthomonadales bacterium]|nr:hypothetical protein [Xanthomonadales bacterium]